MPVLTAAPVLASAHTARPITGPESAYVAFAAMGGESTGKFAGTTGPGAVRVRFAGYVPRYKSGLKKGRCNTSPNAPELAQGAVVSFVLSAVLTT